MPIFDFRCRTCDHEFEALVRSQDVAECPSCHGRDLEKQLSSFAVSSSKRTQAAAAKSRKKAAATGVRDRMAVERESDAHRKEDH